MPHPHAFMCAGMMADCNNAWSVQESIFTCSCGALKLRAPMCRCVTTAEGTKPCTNATALSSLLVGTCEERINNCSNKNTQHTFEGDKQRVGARLELQHISLAELGLQVLV